MTPQEPVERRDKFRRSDLTFKVIMILFAIIQAGIGWGLKEIWTTMKEHDRSIVALQTLDLKERFNKIDDKMDSIIDRLPRR